VAHRLVWPRSCVVSMCRSGGRVGWRLAAYTRPRPDEAVSHTATAIVRAPMTSLTLMVCVAPLPLIRSANAPGAMYRRRSTRAVVGIREREHYPSNIFQKQIARAVGWRESVVDKRFQKSGHYWVDQRRHRLHMPQTLRMAFFGGCCQ